MRNLVQIVLVMGMALAVLSVPTNDCHSSQAIHHLLSIRIDKAGCVWWHRMRASLENLPKPLFVDVDSCADSGCCLDYPACYAVLEDYIGRLRSPHIVVIVHPEAHYLRLNNFLTVVDDIEAQRVLRIDSLISMKQDEYVVATGERARQLIGETQALEREKKRGPVVALGWWEDRDDRIFQSMADSFNISGPVGRSAPPEYQFAQYHDSSYWTERFPAWLTVPTRTHLLPPRTSATPRPVREGDVSPDSVATESPPE